jgi:hypothetical protein
MCMCDDYYFFIVTSLERMAPLIETGRFADIPEDLRVFCYLLVH